MSDLTVVAIHRQRAEKFIRREGLALSQPEVVTAPESLRGRRGTVLVLDRPVLAAAMEHALSMLAQTGVPVINLDSDPLKSAPLDVLGYELVQRYAGLTEGEIGHLDIRLPSLNREYEIGVRLKDAPQEPPEFADAQEALDWLDLQEQRKARLPKRPLFR